MIPKRNAGFRNRSCPNSKLKRNTELTKTNFALARALPTHRVESGIELLACLGERIGGALAGTGEIEAVVAAFPRTGVKAHAPQRLGKLRVFLAAIGTNHDDACSRLYLRNAIIAHGGRPFIRAREGFRARRIGIILPNDCFNTSL